MLAAARRADVKLMYAELICFAPRYVRAKELMDEGAFGRVFQIKHGETHYGPHSDWFWNGELAGGGVMMDMGCHSVEIIRWLYDKPAHPVGHCRARHVRARRTHRRGGPRPGDHPLPGRPPRRGRGQLGQARRHGRPPRHPGQRGHLPRRHDAAVVAVRLQRRRLRVLSREGDEHRVQLTIAEEYYNYGMPQEMQHFTDAVLNDRTPIETASRTRLAGGDLRSLSLCRNGTRSTSPGPVAAGGRRSPVSPLEEQVASAAPRSSARHHETALIGRATSIRLPGPHRADSRFGIGTSAGGDIVRCSCHRDP